MNTPLVLLHGWGFSSRIWQPLLKQLSSEWPGPVCAIDLPGFGAAYHEPCMSLDDTLAWILDQLPAHSVLCGWSLGGMLATQVAARWPERITGLVTIGSNLHFTQHDSWPGMPADDYRQFCERFALQPEKTWRRFLGLQTRGEAMAERHATTLDILANFHDMDVDTVTHMLHLLGEIDNRNAFAALSLPGLHCLGEHDAITPVAVASALQALNPRQSVYVLPAASHAMCITRCDDIAAHLRRFAARLMAASQPAAHPAVPVHATATVTNPPPPIARAAIADSFSRAAAHYDSAALLQREIGDTLFAHMASYSCAVAADIGCGTGFITQKLQDHAAHTLALDIAHGMVQTTRTRCGNRVSVIQADMAQLPLADQCVDLLVSSLALQWSHNPAQVFHEWRRVLRDDGELHFSTFLPGTLRELQLAWQQVDDHVHVNAFIDTDTLLMALHAAGFNSISTDLETRVCFYPDTRTLSQALKTIGAHNMNVDRPRGLTGKQRWQRLQAAYEMYRVPEGLPASYEVLYVSAV